MNNPTPPPDLRGIDTFEYRDMRSFVGIKDGIKLDDEFVKVADLQTIIDRHLVQQTARDMATAQDKRAIVIDGHVWTADQLRHTIACAIRLRKINDTCTREKVTLLDRIDDIQDAFAVVEGEGVFPQTVEAALLVVDEEPSPAPSA